MYWCALLQIRHYINNFVHESIYFLEQKVIKVRVMQGEYAKAKVQQQHCGHKERFHLLSPLHFIPPGSILILNMWNLASKAILFSVPLLHLLGGALYATSFVICG